MNLNEYIGLPFRSHGRSVDGIDCWGLCRLYYEQEKGITLPSFSPFYDSTEDSKAIQDLINKEKSNWQEVDDPNPGDVIVFNIAGKATHVGVYLGVYNFLHVFKGIDSCIESIKHHKWSNRVEGFYRYGND